MFRLFPVVCVALFCFQPNPAHSQFHCAETVFLNSCVNCDGVLFTGPAYETWLGNCFSCLSRCPAELEPNSSLDASSHPENATLRSCGLTWDEFAAEARSAEENGAEPEERYVHVSVGEDLARTLARRAPLIADYLLMKDGYIRFDASDESLSSVTEDPVMLSGFEATTEKANWLIDHRREILTEEGRKSLEPPMGRRLDESERQAVYTNVEPVAPDAALATIRATWFRHNDQQGARPEVLEQQVLELELGIGEAKRIPDDIRPVLGDPLPGRRLEAEIRGYSLHD